jgi:hypothetical protein
MAISPMEKKEKEERHWGSYSGGGEGEELEAASLVCHCTAT